VVTSGDNVTHKHFTKMRRLARDETPFLLAMTPRETTWFGDHMDGSVILLHDDGPNKMTHDETSYLPTRS
jgi:hypothetical protein